MRNRLQIKLLLVLAFILCALGIKAQQSHNPHKAPLYWSVYEHNWLKEQAHVNDNYVPESVLMENVDMVDQHLKSYGYNMICIDGWGDDSQFNEHGYRTTHSQHWEHDYAWWANHLQGRGMNLGMYNNPLWINKGAAASGVIVKGTDIPLASLIDYDEESLWFTWVQVDRSGAEEYVKGYIQYYADMGIKYFRVDFLSWYEDGFDENLGTVGPQRPKEHYETALRWMKEACDANGMLLSLVMPHLKDEAELELKYGHMIRINEDVWNGTWERFSEFKRGQRDPFWSQWANPYDGYTYWSYLSGRNKMILDGDFIRLNTMSNIEEKKTVISLHLMAGGPLTPTDQEGTSMTTENLALYTNSEMLELNYDGFVGKPLFTNDPTDEASQVWAGQMSNGDYIVGIFNREDNTRNRSLDFNWLGFEGNAQVRDLWEHVDFGAMNAISVDVPARGCRIFKVVPNGTSVSSEMYVGGTFNSWTPGTNPMTLNNGVWTANDIELNNGSYELKFVNTNDWSGDDWGNASGISGTASITTGGGPNISFDVDSFGSYKVSFNEQTLKYSIFQNVEHQENMFVVGSFNDWIPGNIPMTLVDEIWVVQDVQLGEGSHELKFVNTLDWMGDDWGNASGLSGTASLTTGGDPNITFSIVNEGSYVITFDDQTLIYSVSLQQGISKGLPMRLVVYPNPTASLLNITLTDEQNLVEIRGVNGEIMFASGNKKEFVIDTSHFQNGIYILSVFTGEGTTLTRRIVVKR